ncbi:MAG: type II toxin-antitoxin system prevent-host-death family antitoxin [Gemmatimonadaceae bacterium]
MKRKIGRVSESHPGAYGRTVQASVFKATCLDLMDEVAESRVPVVVTKHGRPVVKVVPVDEVSMSPVGFLRGSIVRQGDIVAPDPEAWGSADGDPLDGGAG